MWKAQNNRHVALHIYLHMGLAKVSKRIFFMLLLCPSILLFGSSGTQIFPEAAWGEAQSALGAASN